MPDIGRKRERCCFCKLPLESAHKVLHLGQQSITCFPDMQSFLKVDYARLDLVMCIGCGIVQMMYKVDPDKLYTWYGYRSGINESMVAALKSVVDAACFHLDVTMGRKIGPDDPAVVLDIGSNDGTLLRAYDSRYRMLKVGFEPAKNLLQDACRGVDVLVSEFFTAESYLRTGVERAAIVTACAMFYDLEDPVGFLLDVEKILEDRGVLVIQQNYLPSMLENLAYDNVSHEHICYYSLSTLMNVLDQGGFQVFDVGKNDVNGGSFRVYCCKKKAIVSCSSGWGRVGEMLAEERGKGLDKVSTYVDFGSKVEASAAAGRNILDALSALGKKVYVYGASTRGLVQMQKVCGPTPEYGPSYGMFCGAAERNPEKWGLSYSSTGIKCVSEDEARSNADYMLVLPYQFIDVFKGREYDFLARGGRLITLVPSPCIYLAVGGDGKSVVKFEL